MWVEAQLLVEIHLLWVEAQLLAAMVASKVVCNMVPNIVVSMSAASMVVCNMVANNFVSMEDSLDTEDSVLALDTEDSVSYIKPFNNGKFKI